MIVISTIGIVLGLVCMTVDFYATLAGNKTPLHRAGHLAFALTFMMLVCLLWILR